MVHGETKPKREEEKNSAVVHEDCTPSYFAGGKGGIYSNQQTIIHLSPKNNASISIDLHRTVLRQHVCARTVANAICSREGALDLCNLHLDWLLLCHFVFPLIFSPQPAVNYSTLAFFLCIA